MAEESIIRSPDTQREARIPPGQRATEKWPVLHYGSVPRVAIVDWRFHISGLIKRELRLDYNQFTSLPRVKVFSDIHCVAGWSRLDNLWEGISTGVVRELAEILPEARFVIIYGAGRFTTNLSTDDFFAADVLFALKHDGQPLTPEHGYPLRLVVPRLYFWKSAKWVTGIEFVARDKPGFWEFAGYHNHGDPWKEERYG